MNTSVTAGMSGATLAHLLKHRDSHYPISDAYELAHLPGTHWWSSQKEHVTAWFAELAGPGAYGRKSRDLDARHGYTHFQCAPGLLWIAEALGEHPDTVQRAADIAGGVGRPASQCAAIRRVIPWERIETLSSR